MHVKFWDKSTFCQCGISLWASCRTTAAEAHATVHVISKLAGLHPNQTLNPLKILKYIFVYIFLYIYTCIYIYINTGLTFDNILSHGEQPRKAASVYTKLAACKGWCSGISRFALLHLQSFVPLLRLPPPFFFTFVNHAWGATTVAAPGGIQQEVVDCQGT